jgi:hypothetical protein
MMYDGVCDITSVFDQRRNLPEGWETPRIHHLALNDIEHLLYFLTD